MEGHTLRFGLWMVLGLLVVVAALSSLARRLRIPYPVLLVLGGVALALVPGLPHLALQPELVFQVLLPPLLYATAWRTSWRNLRRNARVLLLLAVGLVLFTTVAVAGVAHTDGVGLAWPVAFTLGAILSPTDPVAATAVARELQVPRRVVDILEEESLVNDATALVAYEFALAAVTSGHFSPAQALWRFPFVTVVGTLFGLAVGALWSRVRRRIEDPLVETTLSVVVAYAAYLGAELLGASGVLAAVAAGLYSGWRGPMVVPPHTRLRANAVWDLLTFLSEGAIFILLGLQLREVLRGLARYPASSLILKAVLVSAAVVVVRLAWVFACALLPSLRHGVSGARRPWRSVLVIGWSGMRGGLSLAVALSLPMVTLQGSPFPDRPLLIFLSFSAILATLVLQGLSLPALIKRLHLPRDPAPEREETHARLATVKAAERRMAELAEEGWVPQSVLSHFREVYATRERGLEAREHQLEQGEASTPSAVEAYEEQEASLERFKRALIECERDTLIELRNTGQIAEDVLHRIERELDLELNRF